MPRMWRSASTAAVWHKTSPWLDSLVSETGAGVAHTPGWLSILHFGPNSQIYPFFKFSQTAEDPYPFAMTFFASCAVWVGVGSLLPALTPQASELVSSFAARQVMLRAFKVDVSQIGLDEMREYPELVPACGKRTPPTPKAIPLTLQAGRLFTYQ